MTSKPRFMLLALMALGALLTTSAAKASILTVALDTNATLTTNNTVAIVTGSVACSVGDTFNVTALVFQLHGKTQITGQSIGTSDTPCTGTPQPFSAQVQVLIPANGNYKKGPANVLVGINTTDGAAGFDNQTVTARVHLSH